MNLLNVAITAAVASGTLAPGILKMERQPRALAIQANLVAPAGGTTIDAYVQTSLDQGNTWCDIAQFHFLTTAARKIYNLSSQTVQTSQVTPTDGSLTANTAQDGILGPWFRVKYGSTGTYSAGCQLSIDVAADTSPL